MAEIAGCFTFWAWLRLDKPALWLLPGMGSFAIFASLSTLVDSESAERAYRSIYIVAAICWLWCFEGNRPDRQDVIGVVI